MAKAFSGKKPQHFGNTIRVFLNYLGRHKFMLGLVGVLTAVSALANLLGTYMIKPVINGILETGSIPGLVRGVALTAAIYAVGALSTLGYTQTMVRAAQKVLHDIRRDLFAHLQTLPLSFFDSRRNGELMSLFTNDVDTISDALNNSFALLIQSFITDNKMTRVQLALDNGKATSNSVIDFLYALSPSQWKDLASMDQFKGFADTINTTSAEISKMQNFCGLNIADQPLNYIKAAFEGASIALAIAALLIPILAWATQVLNYKLMPQATSSAEGAVDTMQASMKTMNTVMPLMSAVFCFTFPVGLGIYWIASAVVRSVQQWFINRHLDKMNIDDLVNENMKKIEAKRAKEGLPPQKITNQAHQSAKNINKPVINKGNSGNNGASDRAQKVDTAYEKARSAKPGSITAKANLVRDFDERNKKK